MRSHLRWDRVWYVRDVLYAVLKKKKKKKVIMTHDSYKVLIHIRYYTYYTTIHVHMYTCII